MSGNEFPFGTIPLDLTDLEVTGDQSPQSGVATEVTVSFSFVEPFYSIFLQDDVPADAWPFTVKVYAEGLGNWATEEVAHESGECSQASPDFEVVVPVTLVNEGVYLISALVELDDGAGFVMGYSDKEARISVWTAG